MKKILQFLNEEDNKILTQKTHKVVSVEDFDDIKWKLWLLQDICINNKWVWLSSNQIWDLRSYFIIHTKELKKLFINPEIIRYWGKNKLKQEWCLSYNNWKKSYIYRYEKVKIRYEINLWEFEELELKWLEAQVFQHEIDHMNWLVI